MRSLVGTHLDIYDVTALLGVGGMGEVYRARDTKLNRDVALKVLPELFAKDPDRLARFKREAQVLASLNHPNIAAIYGFEESNDTQALVLELVDGPTLADRIAEGAIPLDEALGIARQVADALEAAHEHGIIHRDLKPANIKLRPDGTVKVLDFGLAKALEPVSVSGQQVTASPTITSPAMTRIGLILGTAAYMSPEQAKGRAADKRSDVWAFGAVLYEMLAGRRAVDGEDVAETLAFVLTKEPDWTALPPDTPATIHKLLRRCLQKDRRKRLADIADARLEIDETVSGVGAAHGTAPTSGIGPNAMAVDRSSRRRFAWAAGGMIFGLALTLGGVAIWNAMRPPSAVRPIRFAVPPPDGQAFFYAPQFLSVSPDGRRIAFVTGTIPSETRLWVRALDSLTAQPIADADAAKMPLWSPDGRSIAFSAGASGLGRLRTVELGGGRALTLADDGIPGAWSANGVILFRGRDGRIYRVPETGGDATVVTALNASEEENLHVPNFFLEDGNRFVYQARSRGNSKTTVYLASLDSSARIRLLDGVSQVAYANGYLLYQRNGALVSQPFDDRSGRITGPAAPLIDSIDYDVVTGQAAFSVSRTGVLAYRSAVGATTSVLTWFARDGKSVASLPLEGAYEGARRPTLSPDARQLAVTRSDGGGQSDVWIIDLERNVPARFTFDGAADSPVWFPDGRRIIFSSNRKGAADLYQRSIGAAGSEQLLFASPQDKRAMAVSPDSKVLLFGQSPEGNPEIWALPLTGSPTPIPIVRTGFPAGNAVFSPDGRWFAYCEGDSGADQVYVQPYPPNGQRIRLSSTSGSSPQWSADGKTVVYTTTANRVVTVEVRPERGTLHVATPRDLFPAAATFSHRSVMFDAPRARLLLPVAPERVGRPGITVVVNWLEAFEAGRRRLTDK